MYSDTQFEIKFFLIYVDIFDAAKNNTSPDLTKLSTLRQQEMKTQFRVFLSIPPAQLSFSRKFTGNISTQCSRGTFMLSRQRQIPAPLMRRQPYNRK